MFLYTGVSVEGSRQCVHTYAVGMVDAEGALLVIRVVVSEEVACRVAVRWETERKGKWL